ncbi:MAG: hypothetical protein ACPK85_05685 [Methanosarcina sp.]
MTPEENAKKLILIIKDGTIESLKIEGLGKKPFIIRNLTFKNVRLIITLPPKRE